MYVLRKISASKKKWILGIILLAAGVFYLRQEGSHKILFLNKTDDHTHDLAFKMSLHLAQKKSGIKNALIFLKELPASNTIESVATEYFEKLRIGEGEGGRGILYLYSLKENQFKIEVSYALEGIFPDAYCRRMEEAAKTYMLSEIPQDFISELIITMNILNTNQATTLKEFDYNPSWLKNMFLSGGAGVKTNGYKKNVSEYLRAIKNLDSQDVKAFLPGSSPKETVDRYLVSLSMGIGDPNLPLITEGSKIFRTIVPRSEAQQHRVLDYYNKALPYTLFFYDKFGLTVFKPGTANLPIVLRFGVDSRWYVDEAKSWTYFHRFEDGSDFFPKYNDIPFIDALKEFGHPNVRAAIYKNRVVTPAMNFYKPDLESRLKELEAMVLKDNSAESFAKLGEFYLFETNWITKAIEAFENAAKRDSANKEYHWRLYDLYLNNSEAEKMLSELKWLKDNSPKDRELDIWYDFYTREYDKVAKSVISDE